MNPIEFSQRLSQILPGSPEAAAIAYELVEDARYPGNFALQRLSTWPDPAGEMKAKQVLSMLGELALAPLATSQSSPNVDIELWAIRTMSQELVAFRARAACVLKSHLSNRNRASRPWEGLAPFPLPSGSRVCDLAILLLHRLLHLEWSPSAFFRVPAVDRDRQIEAFHNSRELRSAM